MHLTFRFILEQILLPSLLTFLLLGGAVGVIVGLGLLSNNGWVMRLVERLNRWVSFRRLLKPLETPHESWDAIQRNRRWLSVVLLIGALYTINGLYSVNLHDLAQSFAERFGLPVGWIEWLLSGMRWFLIFGNGVAILIGAMLAFAPAPLARLNRASNRWISTRSKFKEASAVHGTFDHWVEHWPRSTGALIALFSVVEVIFVARVM